MTMPLTVGYRHSLCYYVACATVFAQVDVAVALKGYVVALNFHHTMNYIPLFDCYSKHHIANVYARIANGVKLYAVVTSDNKWKHTSPIHR